MNTKVEASRVILMQNNDFSDAHPGHESQEGSFDPQTRRWEKG